MARIIKGRQMSARFWHGREVLKEYKQGRLAYEKQTSIPDYLCFTALEAGTFTLTVPAAVTSTYLSYVEYSLDGRNWNRTDILAQDQTIQVGTAQNPIPAGGKVYWRGSGSKMAYDYNANKYSVFSSTARFDVSGHLMSLLVGDNFGNFGHLTHFDTNGIRHTTFPYLFKECTGLVNAKDLILPTFENYYQSIFFSLFRGCTSLVSQPALSSTTLATSCYYGMYYDCTSLTESATLPATTLQESCYRYMYYNCTNLETVNSILATTASGTNCMNQMFRICKKITSVELHLTGALTQACCYQMFQLCSALTYVKCLATDISATNCVTNWLASVSSTGIFIQAEGVTWPSGASGIPTGWVDIEKRTMPQGYKQVEYVANPNKGAFNFEHVFDSATETLEIQFFNIEKKGFFIGTTNNGGYYGSICVDKSTNTAIRIKVGIGDATVNTTSISVTSEKPYVFRYKGKSDGFTIYLNGAAQKVYSGGFNIEHTISNLYVYSAADTASAVETYPDWFGEFPLYSIKVLDANDAAIINLIPCVRESDNLVGFYDFGRNKFYYSLNGNDFTAGQEI